MTTPLTSAAWPEGARLLTQMAEGAHLVAPRAPARMHGNAIGQLNATLTIQATGRASLATDARLPTGQITSAHERLVAHACVQAVRDHWLPALKALCARPGMRAAAMACHFSLSIKGGPGDPLGGSIGLASHAQHNQGWGLRTAPDRITTDAPFHLRAQQMLDAIDTIEALAPTPDAPAWIALYASGSERERMTPLGGVFLANGEASARTLAPILACKPIDPDRLVLMSAPKSAALALPHPLTFR